MTEEKLCYICQSNHPHIDNHHIDCKRGAVSNETVPFCRRCHTTYHIWGVEWFEDEYLDRIIEVENKRRTLYGLSPMKCEDVKRSDYWNETHGIIKEKKERGKRKILPPLMPREMLCGFEWYLNHRNDYSQEDIDALGIEIFIDGEKFLNVQQGTKKNIVKKAMKSLSQKVKKEAK